MKKFDSDVTKKLQESMILDAQLPEIVFQYKFDRHLFFDADICSSDELILTLQNVIRCCFGSDGQVDVYSASDKSRLGHFLVENDWVSKVTQFRKYLSNLGDYGGLILVDVCQKWIAFQPRPVDVGIFGLNSQMKIEELIPELYECFFCCADIENWLSQKTERDEALVESFGLEFLTLLKKNYC